VSGTIKSTARHGAEAARRAIVKMHNALILLNVFIGCPPGKKFILIC
jgi:hypothetical protein